ncbi:MAG TPA: 50S ribosomal protein L24 [Patescibacteria group bacterium]|nr:50S ribosomal protein L24 [Patescibacteria group bacterium]
MKLHKGDEVKVVTGKDKGKSAKIEKVFVKEEKVLLPEINQYKRHMKARMQGETSQIVLITKPLPVANVQLICPKCKKLTRVGYKIEKDKKVRICRKCKATI